MNLTLQGNGKPAEADLGVANSPEAHDGKRAQRASVHLVRRRATLRAQPRVHLHGPSKE